MDDVPVFSKDIYWGKVPESELKNIIESIDKSGFESFDLRQQKRLDFTYDEDRADWRFFLPLSKDATILDIGAGLGRTTIPLARVAKQVIACDQSLSRMRFLKKRAESENLGNVVAFVGNIYDLPLKDNSVDLIVMNGVLEWVGLTNLYKDPRVAQIKSLEICKKLLKKGGHLYIGIENRYAGVYLKAHDHGGLRFTSYMPRFVANLYSYLRTGRPYRTYTYSKNGYTKLLKEAGFETKPNFYLLYPGYNLPRVVVPYSDIRVFQYAIGAFKRSSNKLGSIVRYLISFALVVRVYRFFFYSFGIIAKND